MSQKKKKERGRTRSWTEDLLICSQMLYHWAIRPSTNNSRGKSFLLAASCEHRIRHLQFFGEFQHLVELLVVQRANKTRENEQAVAPITKRPPKLSVIVRWPRAQNEKFRSNSLPTLVWEHKSPLQPMNNRKVKSIWRRKCPKLSFSETDHFPSFYHGNATWLHVFLFFYAVYCNFSRFFFSFLLLGWILRPSCFITVNFSALSSDDQQQQSIPDSSDFWWLWSCSCLREGSCRGPQCSLCSAMQCTFSCTSTKSLYFFFFICLPSNHWGVNLQSSSRCP